MQLTASLFTSFDFFYLKSRQVKSRGARKRIRMAVEVYQFQLFEVKYFVMQCAFDKT